MRIFVAITFAMLTGCATLPQAQAGTTYLVCGSSIRLDIGHDGRFAIVRDSEGRQTTLQRVASSLGTRYAGGGISVLRSGDNYVYNAPDGATLSCEPLQR